MTVNKGDLISREALKKYARVVFDKDLGRLRVVDVSDIDNAPTVEVIPTELHEKIMDKTTGELLECQSNLRPQGEWNYIQAGMCVCPFCGAMPHKEYKNFCAKCGADMRGKDNGKNL